MEPSRFDQLIREKLKQNTDIYADESSKSKAFVWSSVQHNLTNKTTWKWKFLKMAAVFILVFGSTFFIYNEFKSYQNDVKKLTQKIESLHEQQNLQTMLLNEKNQKIGKLSKDLASMKDNVQKQKNFNIPQIVYKTDTVFIREIESIVQLPLSIDSSTVKEATNSIEFDYQTKSLTLKEDSSNMIYPSYKVTKQEAISSEPLKIKLISFVSN